jgi:hypothetical protein
MQQLRVKWTSAKSMNCRDFWASGEDLSGVRLAFRSVFAFNENKTGTFIRLVLYVDNRGIDGRDGQASV